MPDENDRLPVQRRGKMKSLDKAMSAAVAPPSRNPDALPRLSPVAQVARTIEEGRLAREAAPKATVLVDLGDGVDYTFAVPVSVIVPELLKWRDRRYDV